MTIYLVRESYDDGMEGPETESFDHILLSQGGFKTRIDAYAACKALAENRLKNFLEYQDMEFDNELKPDDPGIEYLDDNCEVRTWYIWDEYRYYVSPLEVH